MIKYLEKENMNEVIKSGVWLVDFYADWCGPCKMLSPILEELNTNVLKINVDTHEELATTYGIMSIPTICFFQDGDLKTKKIGFTNRDEIENILKELGD